jgi:hypothetical protein
MSKAGPGSFILLGRALLAVVSSAHVERPLEGLTAADHHAFVVEYVAEVRRHLSNGASAVGEHTPAGKITRDGLLDEITGRAEGLSERGALEAQQRTGGGESSGNHGCRSGRPDLGGSASKRAYESHETLDLARK